MYKKILSLLLVFFLSVSNSFSAPTKVQAKDVVPDTSGFDQNLSPADNTVQKALNTLNDLTIVATPGGSNTQLQYNNAGVLGGISDVVYSGNNIGIGTFNPTEILHVQKTSGSSGVKIDTRSGTAANLSIVKFNRASATNGNLNSDDEVGSVDFDSMAGGSVSTTARISSQYKGNGTTRSGQLKFLTANNTANPSERMVILSDGNVGIGFASGGSPAAGLEIKKGGNPLGTSFRVTNSSSGDYFSIIDGGNVGIGSSNPEYKLKISGNAYTTSTAISGQSLVGTTSATYATTGIINGEQNNSNDMFASQTPSMVLSNLSTATRSLARVKLVANAGSTEGYFFVNGLGTSISSFPATGAAIGTHSNHPFGFFTNGNEVARFTSGGNLGIGSTAPSGKLDLGTSTSPLYMPGIKATTGTRYLCIDTVGKITSSASACSGT